jgi:hypothetical protein
MGGCEGNGWGIFISFFIYLTTGSGSGSGVRFFFQKKKKKKKTLFRPPLATKTAHWARINTLDIFLENSAQISLSTGGKGKLSRRALARRLHGWILVSGFGVQHL